MKSITLTTLAVIAAAAPATAFAATSDEALPNAAIRKAATVEAIVVHDGERTAMTGVRGRIEWINGRVVHVVNGNQSFDVTVRRGARLAGGMRLRLRSLKVGRGIRVEESEGRQSVALSNHNSPVPKFASSWKSGAVHFASLYRGADGTFTRAQYDSGVLVTAPHPFLNVDTGGDTKVFEVDEATTYMLDGASSTFEALPLGSTLVAVSVAGVSSVEATSPDPGTGLG